MTDEKKPPQAVAGAGAQIVLELDQQGNVIMSASCFGVQDCAYASMPDDRLMRFAIPTLLRELREQIRLGRRLTVLESTAIAAAVRQSSSESAMTV